MDRWPRSKWGEEEGEEEGESGNRPIDVAVEHYVFPGRM